MSVEGAGQVPVDVVDSEVMGGLAGDDGDRQEVRAAGIVKALELLTTAIGESP